MNAKAKGARNERRGQRLLEAMGYAVTKSGGSLGSWDLIGLSSTDIVLCQVKSNDWPSSVELERLTRVLRSHALPAARASLAGSATVARCVSFHAG